MDEQAEETSAVVAAYSSGTTPKEELDLELQSAWNALLEDPLSTEDAARILHVDAAALRSLDRPPLGLEARQQGIGVVETAIIIFVQQVGYDLCKDLTKDAAKEALKQLWTLLKNKMEFTLPLGAFGPETRLNEGGDDPTAAS